MRLLSRIPSGVPGLDEILHGRPIPGRMYFLSSSPGTGKTTVGLCFLREGVRQDEQVLCISLGEPVSNLLENATSFSIGVTGINFLDLTPTREFFVQVEMLTFSSLRMWNEFLQLKRFLKVSSA